MSAVQSIGPAIQQAAADPTNAASTLMAAAAAFAGDSAAPTGLEERGDGGQPVRRATAPRTCPHRARCRARRRTCLRASTRPTPSDRSRRRLPAPAPGSGGGPGPRRHPEAAPAPAPAPARGTAVPRLPAAAPAFGPDAPATQDFMYPSISNGCLKDGGNVLATAISVAGSGQDPGARTRGRPDGLRVHRDRHARPGGRAEAAAERHLGQPDHRQVGQRDAQAAAGHQPRRARRR